MSIDTPKAILIEFIEDEAKALSMDAQGSFWPDNHHRITPLVARAHRILDEELLADLFFHLLRLDQCPRVKGDDEFRGLCSAYRRFTPLFLRGYPVCLLPRLKGLLLFGFNDSAELPSEPALTLALYREYLELWRYMDSFWHLPGLLAKRSKFLELSSRQTLVERVQRVLSLTPLAEELRRPGRLWLWALIFLTLQVEEAGSAVVRKLSGEQLAPDDYQFVIEALDRCITAANRKDLADALKAGKGANP